MAYYVINNNKLGCASCEYRNKCNLDKCNMRIKTKYDGMTDFGSDYVSYKKNNIECYAKKYKTHYVIVHKGDIHKDETVSDEWLAEIYCLDRSNYGVIISGFDVIKENGVDRFLYREDLQFHYHIKNKISLKDDKLFIY